MSPTDAPNPGTADQPSESASSRTRRALQRSLPAARLAEAGRATLAAMAAWVLGNGLPGGMADYAYAAALGAFVTVGTTLFTIARTAVQQASGLVIGATVGLAIYAVDVSGLVKIGIIAAVGVLSQGLPRLGVGASMVPVAAVLVILFGGVDAEGYAVAYVGQFSLGMGIGLVVNAVTVPALHDREAHERILVAVQELADRVDVLADMLEGEWPPDRDDWLEWGPELEAWVADVDDELRVAEESRRLNLRTLWHRNHLPQAADSVMVLRALVHRAINIVDALAGAAWSTPVAVHLDEGDRALTAKALSHLAAHLRAWSVDEDVHEASTKSSTAIEDLYRSVVTRQQPETGAATVVYSLRAMRERLDRSTAASGREG